MNDVKALLVIIILLISLVGQAICLGVLRRKEYKDGYKN